jgi:hypothetical protein
MNLFSKLLGSEPPSRLPRKTSLLAWSIKKALNWGVGLHSLASLDYRYIRFVQLYILWIEEPVLVHLAAGQSGDFTSLSDVGQGSIQVKNYPLHIFLKLN